MKGLERLLYGNNSGSLTLVEMLRSIGTLTFFSNYKVEASLNALFSAGSATATFTASRGASNPASYFLTSAGLTIESNSNIPRIAAGMYGPSGWVSCQGLQTEKAATNLCLYSAAIDNAAWVPINMTVISQSPSVTQPISSSFQLTADVANATVLQTLIAAASTRTFSIYLLRESGSGNVQITADGITWTTVPLSTSTWTRHQVSASQLNASFGVRLQTSGDVVSVNWAQYEAGAYATSYVPTDSASVTRNQETLTYLCASNMTETQTLMFRGMPFWAGADLTHNPRLLLSQGDSRWWRETFATDTVKMNPNNNLTPAAVATMTTIPARHTTYNFAAQVTPSGNPNTNVFLGATSEASDNTDYAATNFGTNFGLGCSPSGGDNFDGIIKAFVMYSNVLSSGNLSLLNTLIGTL